MPEETNHKKIEQINKLIDNIYVNLGKLKRQLEQFDKEQAKDIYRDVEGIVGIFDGQHLISEDGAKHSVPGNYAAKSRLVYGDTLKLIKEDGKDVFKQIEKVARKRIEGILSKKEGKWYILADSGSYKISDVAADFNKAALNDEAVAFIPEGNVNAPYAALDKIKRQVQQEVKQEVKPIPVKKERTKEESPKKIPESKPTKSVAPTKPVPVKKPAKPKEDNTPKEFVAEIVLDDKTTTPKPLPTSLEEDDLR